MIRKASATDFDKIMPLWLATTAEAHSFIPHRYWEENCAYVRHELLSQAETFVYMDKHQIKGFISLINGTHIGALFVAQAEQGRGIGRKLIEYVRRHQAQLSLNVYVKNQKALEFYHHCGFIILSEEIDNRTGEKELLMVWAKGCFSGHKKRFPGDS